MIKKILASLGIIVLALFVYAGLQSPDYTISREIEINASPEVIFPHLNDAVKMNTWMPWADSDPKMKLTYSGPVEGVGAKSHWTSEGSMGDGEAEIIESQHLQLVRSKLVYLKPMQMTQVADMLIVPTEAGAKVTWSVGGQNNFITRVVLIFFDMDKMVGAEFDKGLQKLKTIIESQ